MKLTRREFCAAMADYPKRIEITFQVSDSLVGQAGVGDTITLEANGHRRIVRISRIDSTELHDVLFVSGEEMH